MDIKTSRKDFNGEIILSRGYCGDIYNFLRYDLNALDDKNFYNCGVYGWNWSIKRFKAPTHYAIYIINAYRNSPNRADRVDYNAIEKYFKRIIKNYRDQVKNINWRDREKLNKKYINRIAKKLNTIIK